jgi:DinB superfamily
MATRDAIDELMEKMREQREALLAEAEALSDEQACYVPADATGEAQWSPKQQLAHLAEMETSYRSWVKAALAEDDPDVSNVRGLRPAIPLTEAQRHSVNELTAQLRRERETTLALIASLAAEQFERTASQPMFGRLTVMQWLRSYYRHDRMHRDQMAGREPEYRPRFVGGQEPDQRR